MKIFTTTTSTLFVSCCLLIQGGNAYSLFKNSVPTTTKASASTDEIETTSRRNLLRAAAALSAGALLGSVNPGVVLAADDDVATPVYFGVGVSSRRSTASDKGFCILYSVTGHVLSMQLHRPLFFVRILLNFFLFLALFDLKKHAHRTNSYKRTQNKHKTKQCFWHIQHEFIIQGEKEILGRGPSQYTSAAGYAGGKSADKEGRVCYHNFQGVADYGKLGHGEVVGMTIPQSKIVDFSDLYFSLYNPKTKGA